MFCKIVCIPGYRSVKGGLIFLYQQLISVLLQYDECDFFLSLLVFIQRNKVYTKSNSCVVPRSFNLPNGTVLLLFLQYLGHSG